MLNSRAAPRIEVYAHRGLRAYSPENTLPGYQAMLEVGADWVDMDVVLTKDGEVLVSHDPVLNPDTTRDENGKFLAKNRESIMTGSPAEMFAYVQKYTVKNLTLAELRRFDVGRLNPESAYSRLFPDQHPVDGTRMPTLREVVRYIQKRTKGKIGFQIEMKALPTHPELSPNPEKFAAALAEILKSEKIVKQTEIQSFDFTCLSALQKIDRRFRTAYLTSRDHGEAYAKDYGGSIPKMVKALGGFAWEPEDATLTPESLKEAKDLGLKVVVWSWPEKLGMAFDPKLVEKMIDWRVDGIITDDPGRLNSMLAARGLPTPQKWRR